MLGRVWVVTETFAGLSVLSFFYSAWAHRTIDTKRLELVELYYPKRPAEEEHLSSETWYHHHKNDKTYGARAVAAASL